MTERRYTVICSACGEIEADTDDGLFSKATANRRAGFHEGIHTESPSEHDCSVEIAEETAEYRCPVCHTLCVGDRERDEHAKSEPGVQPSHFTRV